MLAKIWPQNCGNEGKHIEASTPPAFMSSTRRSTSQHPARISSKRVGSMPYSSWGRPETAFRPKFGNSTPSNSHISRPVAVSTMRGARSANRSGRRPSNIVDGSTRWSSTLMSTRSSGASIRSVWPMVSLGWMDPGDAVPAPQRKARGQPDPTGGLQCNGTAWRVLRRSRWDVAIGVVRRRPVRWHSWLRCWSVRAAPAAIRGRRCPLERRIRGSPGRPLRVFRRRGTRVNCPPR